MTSVMNLIKWYRARLSGGQRLSLRGIRARVINLGNWLKERNYIGFDVRADAPPREISTVYGFGLNGWINLYRLSGQEAFLREAEACLERLLATQTLEGVWLFPYPFRNNSANFPYACENFMTLRALFYYWEHVERSPRVVQSIQVCMDFLIESIGYEGGIFWYSSADRIKVPNISSMAANAFARAYLVLGDGRYIKQAKIFADYCVDKQSSDGAYPYFEGKDMVYVPYHALETWELQEANDVIKSDRIEKSTNQAMIYLTDCFRTRGYTSYSTGRSIRHTYLFKTPLWGAKAYLSKRDLTSASKHLGRALSIFQSPGRACYFYILRRIGVTGLALEYPVLCSTFIRYNASCFEIGTSLLLQAQEDQA